MDSEMQVSISYTQIFTVLKVGGGERRGGGFEM